MSDLDVRLRIETSPCSSIEESDVSDSCQEDHGTWMNVVEQPLAEAVSVSSQPQSDTVDAGGQDDEQKSREKKNDASGADRAMIQAQLQLLEDMLKLYFNWSAPKKQSDSNAAKSGLQGDKKEVLGAIINMIDFFGTITSLQALREGDASSRDSLWTEICQGAALHGRSESALPPRSILRGPDNRQCNNGRGDDKDGGSKNEDSDIPKIRKKSTVVTVGTCVLHQNPDCELEPKDYRSCRLHIRRSNVERHLRQLLSRPWNGMEKLWEDLDNITKTSGKI